MPPVVTPFVPQYITVHLGTPSSNAPNVTVSFSDYVKNVASSEIYPTWDESALRANILAITSFALILETVFPSLVIYCLPGSSIIIRLGYFTLKEALSSFQDL